MSVSSTVSAGVPIFLDFDGAMHPYFPVFDEGDPAAHHFCDAPAFEVVLRQCPQAYVVISSTWRRGRTLDQLRSRFSEDIRPCIVGVTPVLPDSHGAGVRQREAEAWLEQAGCAGVPWVAVDDVVDGFSPGACVVVTHDGFKEREQALLAEALADPIAYAQRYPVQRFG